MSNVPPNLDDDETADDSEEVNFSFSASAALMALLIINLLVYFFGINALRLMFYQSETVTGTRLIMFFVHKHRDSISWNSVLFFFSGLLWLVLCPH